MCRSLLGYNRVSPSTMMFFIGFGIAAALLIAAAVVSARRGNKRNALLAGVAALVVLAGAAFLQLGNTAQPQSPVESAGVQLPDFDRNGIPDLVFFNRETRAVSVWLLTAGSPVSVSSTPLTQSVAADWEPVAVAAAVPGEDKPGIVLQNTKTRQISIWVMGGASGTEMQRSIELPTIPAEGWTVFAGADLDRNGTSDLLLWNAASQQVSSWLLADGASGPMIADTPVIGSAVPGWTPKAACDFDGNGRADLILQNNETRQISFWLFGGASGFERLDTPVIQPSAERWAVRGCSNLDRSGAPDIILHNPDSGGLSAWLMGGDKGLTTLSTPSMHPVSAGWVMVPAGI